MVLKVAFVSEKHYPALQLACEPDVVGNNYADYLMIINEQREESKMLGIPFDIVRINPETFALWCGKKKATWEDLLRYTGSTFPEPINPAGHSGKFFFAKRPGTTVAVPSDVNQVIASCD